MFVNKQASVPVMCVMCNNKWFDPIIYPSTSNKQSMQVIWLIECFFNKQAHSPYQRMCQWFDPIECLSRSQVSPSQFCASDLNHYLSINEKQVCHWFDPIELMSMSNKRARHASDLAQLNGGWCLSISKHGASDLSQLNVCQQASPCQWCASDLTQICLSIINKQVCWAVIRPN